VTANLKAPFPWFGGKRKVADMVWQRFGDVANYVERERIWFSNACLKVDKQQELFL
jgi:hypothetical protein